jgi:hypothetical protein
MRGKMSRLTKVILMLLMTVSLGACNGAAAQNLDGLYLMTRISGGSLEMATYYFHGAAVVRNPVGSTRGLDVQAERAAHPNDVGTFGLQGGQLTLNFPDNNHQARYEKMNGGFGWDGGIFSPVDIFKPGTTLDGTFTGGNSVGSGAVMASSDITFNRDGTYSRDSIGTFSSKNSTSEVSGGSQGADRGRYRIDGTALHMTPNGGKEIVYTTFPWDDGTTGPTPRAVYMGGAMMTRK